MSESDTRREVSAAVREDGKSFSISVVVPAYNEEGSLQEFHRRLWGTLKSIPCEKEIIYVNDGSTDRTLSVLLSLKEMSPEVSILDLSRNYGKEIAMTAGLDHSRGDAVIIMDADLQHPPELIPEMLKYWSEGYDEVYAQRVSRDDESGVKKFASNIFYNIMKKLGRFDIPENSSDFRILSRRAVDAVCELREQHRFMKGLFAWVGFKQKAIPYAPETRVSGKTKWNYWSLWNFAIEGVTSFSTAPLKLASYVGAAIALLALLYALFVVVSTLIFGNPVKGYPSLVTIMLFLGGVQLIFIGIIGEYVSRIFDETKNRPLYLVSSHHPSALGSNDEHSDGGGSKA